MDFAVSADENQRKYKQILGPCQRAGKAIEHEKVTVITVIFGHLERVLKGLEKRLAEL